MRDWSKLDAASEAISFRDRKFQRALGEPWEGSAKSIKIEIESALGAIIKDRSDTADHAPEELGDLLLLYDMHLLQICDLSYFGWKNMESRTAIIWPNGALPSRPSRNSVFYILTTNLAHAMQAFRLVSVHGYEHQARNILRNICELADVMTMVLADEEFYRGYIMTFDDHSETQKHWRKMMGPSVVRKRLEHLDAADPIFTHVDASPSDIRKQLYSWLSMFTHNNFAAHIVAAHPVQRDGGMQSLSMLGMVGSMSRATFAHGLLYLWVTSIRISRLLWTEHKWGRFRGARNRRWTQYRFAVIDEMSRSYVPMFWKNEYQER